MLLPHLLHAGEEEVPCGISSWARRLTEHSGDTRLSDAAMAEVLATACLVKCLWGAPPAPGHREDEIPIARRSVMCLHVVLGYNSSNQSDCLARPELLWVFFRKEYFSRTGHWLLLTLGLVIREHE